jgi:acyl-homoserine-lactone acylase
MTAIGLPMAAMGHTDRVAWCMTNNNPDLFDLFLVTTSEQRPGEYNFHGEWRRFREQVVTLRYRSGEEMRESRVPLRTTEWGPVMPGRNVAVRMSMLGTWNMMDQVLHMMRSRNVNQLREAVGAQGLSMWNVVFADSTGSIGYQYNARVPRRDPSFNWNRPVDGSDPKTRWGPLWTNDELPHVINPRSGLLINGNSAPDLTPLGDEIKAEAWPRYVTSYGHTTRYDRLAELLSPDQSVTVEEAKQYATDTFIRAADKAVLALVRAGGSARSSGPGMSDNTAEGLRVLQAWDRRADPDSKGCALYLYWLQAEPGVPGLVRKAQESTWTDDESRVALSALGRAGENLRRQHQSLDAPWSSVQVSIRGQKTVPVSGFGVPIGGGPTVAPNFGPMTEGKIRCRGGSSFRMIVHLAPRGVQSWSILPYGNSQDPANPHYSDQMEMFGQGKYKHACFGLSCLRREAKTRIQLRSE